MDEPKSPPVASINSPQVGGPPVNLPIALPAKPFVVPQSPTHPPLPSPVKSDLLPRSSIRTMESDIKSAQTGQLSKGIEVKTPSFSAEPPQPVTPPKPPVFVPVPPVGVKLGEAEKRTAPLPGQEKLVPKLEPKLPETKVGLGVIEKKPISPLALPKPPVPPVKSSGIFVPTKPSIFANKRVTAIVAVGILVVLGGVLYWYLGNPPTDGPEKVVSPTPTPAVSVTPPDFGTEKPASTLSGIFGTFYHLAISAISESQPDPLADFKFEAVDLSNTHSSEQNIVATILKGSSGVYYKFSEFLDRFSIGFPINLVSFVDNNDFALILTKQTEFFDQGGKLIVSPSAKNLLTPKIALAVRVVDATEAGNQLTFWEDTMIDSFREFYDLPPQYGDLHFSDNSYQGVPIRFVNFPFPDNAIDYAIVTAKNGNDYLVIANSREQMYSIIDKLLGF
ncbi:MAG: hypothetical protein G01um101444_265 [Parcubacteria group bacterium Gr01-1014_44]|nr:MAG: hypothetical protein G01um101444_265 [Parcubacteria group bacterium Gr01-1014_44]